MKKLIALLLAVMMCMAMAVPAFAVFETVEEPWFVSEPWFEELSWVEQQAWYKKANWYTPKVWDIGN